MKGLKLWLPLVAFVAVLGIIASALYRPADRTVYSAMVGKPLPAFETPPLLPGKPGLASAAFHDGKPKLLNIFASWCVPCVAEAPQLMALKAAGVTIEGVAIRDTPQAMRDFLARVGDPYAAIGDDTASAVQLSLGSSGVPESFLIDGNGTILLQHVGDIRADEVPGIVAKLRAAR
ncbi:redoxin family protein [Sphingomonas sp. NFR15]|uniref:redoxin family protein n=1 Tax=Sphingomonas sp. NFR15 TaxID=1566282 RepID=UPI000883BA13|nr:redoxin family protein [Sphingomonas sp. NFR15]SDA12071.1 cytochrome c biogenesis protein CcmG, thiol:disulfide interchange protein DsbE [Sphingomonas sp. NFR15]